MMSDFTESLKAHDWGWRDILCYASGCDARARAYYRPRYLCRLHLREALG